jgi:hypothetical protein
MKRKLIILLALTVATVGITACGKTETTETEPTEVVETTEVVTEDTETELVENTESDTESLAEGIDSDNDGTIGSYDTNVGTGDYTGDQLALGVDYATEMGKKYKEETGLGEDYLDAYREYAKSQGADKTDGAYFVYYNGSAAGSEPSYMIDPRDGTRYELGDEVPGYGVFYGTHDEFQQASYIDAIRECEENGWSYEFTEDGLLSITTH